MQQEFKNKILQGDSLTVLKTLPNESIDCIITSPPYWALRDYKVDGQIGNEKTIDEYINNLSQIFNECKRILKREGTCWVVLGDTYAGSGGAGGDYNEGGLKEGQPKYRQHKIDISIKSLCLIPERFSLKMIENKWILRNKIIWYKPNCMPSSAKDRYTVDYENIYFFTKSQRYYFKTQYDRTISKFSPNTGHARFNPAGYYKMHFGNSSPTTRIKRCVWKIATKPFPEAHFAVFPEELVKQCLDAGCPEKRCLKCGHIPQPIPKSIYESENGKREIINGDKTKPYSVQEREGTVSYRKLPDMKSFKGYINEKRKEKKLSVETIEKDLFKNQAPHHWFSGESYPSIEDWHKLKQFLDIPNDNAFEYSMIKEYYKPAEKLNYSYVYEGFTNCNCNIGFDSGIVLDPFMGSGTVALVALKNAMNFVGIELNPEYIKIAEKRIEPYLKQEKLTQFTSK